MNSDAYARDRGELRLRLQPGFGLDLYGDPTVAVVTGEARCGARLKGGPAGMGVWVVPALGVVTGDGDTTLITTGTLQIGAIFGLGGG